MRRGSAIPDLHVKFDRPIARRAHDNVMITLLEIDVLEWAVKFDPHGGIIINGDFRQADVGCQPKRPFQ